MAIYCGNQDPVGSDASSAGYRLLASFAPGVASREPESRRSPALAPRKRRLAPTFRFGAFFFVSSALVDVPSTHLTLSTTDFSAVDFYVEVSL